MADPPSITAADLTRNVNAPESFSGPRASSIFEIPNTVWRDTLVPASFAGMQFHCEQNSVESGRRLIVHEYPKRDQPYTEDMGHRAITWEVRGYIIAYPYDVANSVLYTRDYRNARDDLIRALNQGGPAALQMQTLPSLIVYCERYRLTETEKLGGYCVFDMTFREAGFAPFAAADTRTSLINRSTDLRNQILSQLASPAGGGVQT
jgi:prophage DNA circulation protein